MFFSFIDPDFSWSDPDFRPIRTQEKKSSIRKKTPDPKHRLKNCQDPDSVVFWIRIEIFGWIRIQLNTDSKPWLKINLRPAFFVA